MINNKEDIIILSYPDNDLKVSFSVRKTYGLD